MRSHSTIKEKTMITCSSAKPTCADPTADQTEHFPIYSRDLEDAADVLLKEAGLLGRRGVYSEAGLARKIRRQNRRPLSNTDIYTPDEAMSYVVERQLDDLVDVARLTALQEICFRLHLAGFSIREIARRLSVNKQIMWTNLNAAKRKLRFAYKDGKYAGWHEVYLAEVNRPIYRPPRSRLS